MKRTMMVVAAVALTGGALFGARDATAGGGCHDSVMSDAAGVAVDMKGSCFWPTVVRIQPGESITWTNRDSGVLHTATGVAQSWGTYDELTQGQSVSYQFDNSGVFPYFCMLHPSMVGAVVVGDGSAAAATGAGEGAELVSAVGAAGPEENADQASQSAAEADDDGNGVAVTLVVGAVLAAGLIGTSAGVAIARRGKGGAA